MSLELVENVSGMNVVILKKVQHQVLYRWSPLCIGLYIGSHRWIIELGWFYPHGWCFSSMMRKSSVCDAAVSIWEGGNLRGETIIHGFLSFVWFWGYYPLFDLKTCMTWIFGARIIWTLLSVTFVRTEWFAIWGDFETWNSVCCVWIAVCYRCWVRGSSNKDWKK